MSIQEIYIYKSLFRKNNLKEHNIKIPNYLQPLTFMALETDDLLKQILMILGYIGTDIHIKTFKSFLLNYTILEVKINSKLKEKPFITKTTLNKKLKTLELINLIEIKDYRIRLTSQALSYCNNVYTKTETRATFESKLEKVTKAKLIAYTSSLIETKNDKELEKQNIYRYYPDGFVILKSNDRETFKIYKNKLENIKFIIMSEIQDNLKNITRDYMKNKDIYSLDFKSITIDPSTVEIYIESEIYDNYKSEVNSILSTKNLSELWGSKVAATTEVNYAIRTY